MKSPWRDGALLIVDTINSVRVKGRYGGNVEHHVIAEELNAVPPPGSLTKQAARRPPGEARRLLLAAARDLFARRDYRSTTTREIAEAAGVTEYLLFRHFGSKAGLFREALVVPFTDFVARFGATWHAVIPEETDEEDLAREFVGQLYDVLLEHRGLLLTLVASEGLSADDVEATGINDVHRAIGVLGTISSEGISMRGMRSAQPDLPAHSTVAMIVGMVAMRATFFGDRPPPRDAIVDELVQATLHGFLHRPG